MLILLLGLLQIVAPMRAAGQWSSGLLPNLSPGAVKATTKEQVCATPYAPDDPTRLNATLLGVALGRYGILYEERTQYDVVWVVPSSLGGIPVTKNLAPLPKQSEWNATRKHQVERRVYDQLCAAAPLPGGPVSLPGGQFTVPEAQQKAGVEWIIAWHGFFGR